MTTMLERAARAMYEAEPGLSPTTGPQWDWDWMVSEGWALPDAFRRRARAALMAIREPSRAVIKAAWGDAKDGYEAADLPENNWPAMIDAILNEGEQPK